MRMRTAPLLLSSMLIGCFSAHAQSHADPFAPAPATDADATDVAATTPGAVRQPTVDEPGTVFGITVGELYTDNVRLAGRDQPNPSSWITKVEPFVRTAWGGTRFSGVVDYSLSGYMYAGHGDRNQLAQQLDAQATMVAVPQHLFVDANATYAQEIIDDHQPAASGTYFLNNNMANVGTASLSPYWVQSLGRVGDVSVRYTRGRVMYNRHGFHDDGPNRLQGRPDVDSDRVQVRMASPDDQTWTYHAAYNQQRLHPDGGGSLDFADASAGVAWQTGLHVRLKAEVGKENRYRSDGSVDKLGAGFWDAGFEWSGLRDHLELTGGHHFYGRSAHFSWTHKAALLRTELRYEEEPTDLNRQFLDRRLGLGLNTLPTHGTSGIPALSEQRVYLMKRATASASYELPRGQLRFAAYRETRDYFLAEAHTEKVADAQLAWRIDLGASTTVTPAVGWQRYRFRDGQVNVTRYVQVGAVHQFNPNNFATLRLHHGSRDTHAVNPSAHGFRVNVVFLEWTHLF